MSSNVKTSAKGRTRLTFLLLYTVYSHHRVARRYEQLVTCRERGGKREKVSSALTTSSQRVRELTLGKDCIDFLLKPVQKLNSRERSHRSQK